MHDTSHRPVPARHRSTRRRWRLSLTLAAAAALVAGVSGVGASAGVDAIEVPVPSSGPAPGSPVLAAADDVAWVYTYDISSPPSPAGENFHVLFDVGLAPDGRSVVVGEYFGTVVIGSGASQVTLSEPARRPTPSRAAGSSPCSTPTTS